jgi:quinol monooxygenase YgiN
MSQQVTVVARLVAKAGLESRVKSELLKMVEETHKEPGCINYDLHICQDDPRVFVFYENWVSKEALDKHLQTPHFLHLSSIVEDLFSEAPEIKLYELISSGKPVAVV